MTDEASRMAAAIEMHLNTHMAVETDTSSSCQTQTTRLDQIISTCILCLFFLIGTLSNLSFISIYVHKQRRRLTPKTAAKNCSGGGGSGATAAAAAAHHHHGVSIRSTCMRIKNQASNKAIFTLSISNLLLSSLFIPYTIVFRVWNVDANWLLLAILEQFKDNLLYMNLLIITILSIERFVAVCKPQHYKKLESNINKIIWIVFVIAFVLSATNYFIDVKEDLVCTASIFTTPHHNHHSGKPHLNESSSSLLSNGSKVEENESLSININLLTSGVLFSASACITTFFYVQIAWHHLKRARQFKRKCANSSEYASSSTIKRVSIDNKSSASTCAFPQQQSSKASLLKKKSSTSVVIALGGGGVEDDCSGNYSATVTKLSKAVETTLTCDDDEEETNSLMHTMSRHNGSSFKAVKTATTMTTTATTSAGAARDNGNHDDGDDDGSGTGSSGGGGCGGGESTTNQCENTTSNNADNNEESEFSKCKSDACVQTDFVVVRKAKKTYKKRYSNIFATNLITKISIWLSVIIWVSILPFLLSVLEIVPQYKFIYFLYYIENVFSPLVYICLNKRYRNYLKKVFKMKFKL